MSESQGFTDCDENLQALNYRFDNSEGKPQIYMLIQVGKGIKTGSVH